MGVVLVRGAVPASASVALSILSLVSVSAAASTGSSADPSQSTMRIFIATTSFAALSLLFAIFTRIGRLNIPSSTDMAFNPAPASTFSHSRGTSSVEEKHTEDKCSSAPHNSGPGGGDARVWSGAQVAPRSSSLVANVGGILSRPPVDATPDSTPPPQTAAAAAAAPQPTSLPPRPQRTSTLTAARVIWL